MLKLFVRLIPLIVTASGCLSLLCLPQLTLASSFEWLDRYAITTPDGSPCCATQIFDTLKWWINTSGNFYEYRTVYVATSTDDTMPTLPTTCNSTSMAGCGAWQELSECEHEGYVNGTPPDSDHCTVNTGSHPNSWFRGTGAARLFVRVTDQYFGCGAYYNAIPNASACGDVIEANYPLR